MKNFLNKIKRHKKEILIIGIISIILVVLTIVIRNIFPKKNEISTENPTIKEFENYLKDSIKPFTEETIKNFIESTDNVGTVDSNYWGIIYTSPINDDIKILYALSRLFYDDSDLINYMATKNMFDSNTGLGEVKLSLKFIDKVLNAKFVDTKIKENTILTGGFFYGINTVICDTRYCSISINPNTSSGASSDGIYKNSDGEIIKTSDGYAITDEYYYYEFSFSGAMKLAIYDNAFKDTTYCETTIAGLIYTEFDVPQSCKEERTFNKVKFNFDKNYKFINKENL